jgi:hypothetical protein
MAAGRTIDWQMSNVAGMPTASMAASTPSFVDLRSPSLPATQAT